MSDDSIVTEVREQRARLLATAGGTLESLVAYLRQREREAGRSPVNATPSTPAASSSTG